MEAVVQHGCEIAGHALHAARADCLHARLLDGLEHGARLLAAGLQLAMERPIVTRDAQRDGVGVTAYDRGFGGVKLARRLRQARLATSETRPLGRERHVEVVLARDRAQAA